MTSVYNLGAPIFSEKVLLPSLGLAMRLAVRLVMRLVMRNRDRNLASSSQSSAPMPSLNPGGNHGVRLPRQDFFGEQRKMEWSKTIAP
jgi:hypothetical protein